MTYDDFCKICDDVKQTKDMTNSERLNASIILALLSAIVDVNTTFNDKEDKYE